MLKCDLCRNGLPSTGSDRVGHQSGATFNQTQRLIYLRLVILSALTIAWLPVHAEPWAAPGDLLLRTDLELLNDSGVINVPLTSWPIAWGDIDNALTNASLVVY